MPCLISVVFIKLSIGIYSYTVISLIFIASYRVRSLFNFYFISALVWETWRRHSWQNSCQLQKQGW